MFTISQAADGTIRMSGRLDASQVDRAESVFDRAVDAATVDMAGLEYISSAGISVLLRAYKRAGQAGLKMHILNMSPSVRTVFRYSGLEQIFSID